MTNLVRRAVRAAAYRALRVCEPAPGAPAPIFSSFSEALKHCQNGHGYEASHLVDLIFRKTEIHRDRVSQASAEWSAHDAALASCLLRAFAEKKAPLSVLDFGGACGAHYFTQSRIAPQALLDWQVVETEAMSQRASALADGRLSFFSSLEAATETKGAPDLVLASSVLHYLPSPLEQLERLATLGARRLVFLRMHMTTADRSRVFVQKSKLSENGVGPLPPEFADGEVSYPITVFPRAAFERVLANAGYRERARFSDGLQRFGLDERGAGHLFELGA